MLSSLGDLIWQKKVIILLGKTGLLGGSEPAKLKKYLELNTFSNVSQNIIPNN